MCGILFHYSKESNFNEAQPGVIFSSLVPTIRARGGDFEQTKIIHGGSIELYSSVLSLRQPFLEQPMESSRFVIQFNGELYNPEIPESMNDVSYLYSKLTEDFDNDILKTIGHLLGEFAYCITDKHLNKVYFGKDIMGKKSLCYSTDEYNKELYVSSCPPTDHASRKTFNDCENAKIYIYDLNYNKLDYISFDSNVDLPNLYRVSSVNKISGNEDNLIADLHSRLKFAVNERISTIFPLPQDITPSKFSILFSGGIDCTLLAALCGELLCDNVTIDLLNVSFCNPRIKMDPKDTPDRKLAEKSCYELNKIYNSKGVIFKLVEIDVSYEEYLTEKEKVIDLIYPNDTEMDLSIAIAFYFATRGRGKNYTSNCKVLLSGLGADELFGGYTRHERIFTGISNQTKRKLKGKPEMDNKDYDIIQLGEELKNELQCDLSRLWERNLSRDDKVISCWNKEVRYPFLDHHFIRWVSERVPLNYKLKYVENTGEIIRKYALRLLAERLELTWVVNEPKRAIQFGARSAKMEVGSGKAKGTDKLY